MVTFVKGDIFTSPAQVIANAVNCVGVMGKGIALEFKTRYPAMFADYQRRCERGEVKPGFLYIWEDEKTQILNFPTKRHWRDPSLLSDVEEGLKYLAQNYAQLGIDSLAMPALGCGLGGLKWSEVKPLFEKYLGKITDLEVYVYEPNGVRSEVENSSKRNKANANQSSNSAAKPVDL